MALDNGLLVIQVRSIVPECGPAPTFTLAVAGTRASARSCLRHTKKEVRLIYLDTHMHCEAYKEGGICFRNHRRAESPRDPGPPGLVGTVGRRHRAPTAN